MDLLKRLAVVGGAVIAVPLIKNKLFTSNKVYATAVIRNSDDDNLLRKLTEIHPISHAKVDNRFVQEAPPLDELRLKSVQVFFRHGARLPLKTIPNTEQTYWNPKWLDRVSCTDIDTITVNFQGQPHLEMGRIEKHYRTNILRGGVYSGQLTSLGQVQTYNLGRRLCEDYIINQKLIPCHWDESQLKLRSTNLERTKESLRCVVTGIYGLDHLKQHEPIRITVQADGSKENLVPTPRYCPTLHQAVQRAHFYIRDIPGLTEITDRINDILGYDVGGSNKNPPLNMIDIRDDMVARQAHGYALPDGFTDEVIAEVERIGTATALYSVCGKPEDREVALVLGVGLIYHEVIDNMVAIYNNETSVKMFLYSCHDTTLLPMLAALDLFDDKWPPYAADLRYELYEDCLGDHWVRILYCNNVLQLPNSKGDLCRLEQFLEQTSHITLNRQKYGQMCHPHIPQRHIMDSTLLTSFWENKRRTTTRVSL